MVWLKLDRSFFSLDHDIYICGAYMWGEDSPANNTIDTALFELLQADVNHFEKLGRIFVTGDFNGRIGQRLDYIAHDALNTIIDNIDYVPDIPLNTASMDNVCNAQGQILSTN